METAEVTVADLSILPEQTMTVPLIVRLPSADVGERTVPLTVRIASPTAELLLPTTFKTGAALGGED